MNICYVKNKFFLNFRLTWNIGKLLLEKLLFIFTLVKYMPKFIAPFTADGDCSHEIKRHLLLGRKEMNNLDSILKKQRHYFANKGLSGHSYGFSSGHVWM